MSLKVHLVICAALLMQAMPAPRLEWLKFPVITQLRMVGLAELQEMPPPGSPVTYPWLIVRPCSTDRLLSPLWKMKPRCSSETLPSQLTIVDATTDHPEIIREGPISAEDIEAALKR